MFDLFVSNNNFLLTFHWRGTGEAMAFLKVFIQSNLCAILKDLGPRFPAPQFTVIFFKQRHKFKTGADRKTSQK